MKKFTEDGKLIIELTKKGKSPKKISNILNKPVRQVNVLLNYYRSQGYLPPTTKNKKGTGVPFSRHPVAIGRLYKLLLNEPHDFQRWVIEQSKAAGTVSLLALLCMRDAYHDEVGDEG